LRGLGKFCEFGTGKIWGPRMDPDGTDLCSVRGLISGVRKSARQEVEFGG